MNKIPNMCNTIQVVREVGSPTALYTDDASPKTHVNPITEDIRTYNITSCLPVTSLFKDGLHTLNLEPLVLARIQMIVLINITVFPIKIRIMGPPNAAIDANGCWIQHPMLLTCLLEELFEEDVFSSSCSGLIPAFETEFPPYPILTPFTRSV
jgi:hypothetical protein